MKPVFSVALFLFCAALVIVSCQKEIDDTAATGVNGSSGSFRATIGTTAWTASFASATRINGMTSIVGLGSKKTIVFTLTDTVVGTYILNDTALHVGVFVDSLSGSNMPYTTNASDDTAKASGVITITQINRTAKTISGAFRFKAFRIQDSAVQSVTAGVFENLSYATTLGGGNGGGGGSTTDTFRVKIDGVDFVPTLVTGVNMSGIFGISAAAASGAPAVGFQLPQNLTVGSYDLGGFTTPITAQYNPNATTFLLASTGTMQVLEHNTTNRRIRATFNFTAAPSFGMTGNTAVLTQGYFSVRYQ